jgi:hypothetical protein
MTLSPTSRVFSKTSPSRLGTYLATAVGSCGLATSVDGAIVNIDLTDVQGADITAPNGGLAPGQSTSFADWLGAGTGKLDVYNGGSNIYGLDGDNGLVFAVLGTGTTVPRNFASNATIDSSATWSQLASQTAFRTSSSYSANFDAGSFMGFRFGTTGNFNYGWIEATWNSSTNTFQLLSAAYESTPETAILAGAAAPVPEPSTGALAALVLGGAALGVARRRRKQEAAATTEQAV